MVIYWWFFLYDALTAFLLTLGINPEAAFTIALYKYKIIFHFSTIINVILYSKKGIICVSASKDAFKNLI
jgi:hypothetical protein